MRRFDSSGTLHFMGLSAELGNTGVSVIAVQWENSMLNSLQIFSRVMGYKSRWQYCLPVINWSTTKNILEF